MKYKMYTVFLLAVIVLSPAAYSQVYKTAADTVRLNKEFVAVSNDIATMTAKLTVLQNNKPGYQSKAEVADNNAQAAAVNSSEQASKATTTGGVKEARKAKHQAKKAYREAKDARGANDDVSSQNSKIAYLTGQLAKKQERLQQLIEMRTAIYAQLPPQ